MYSIYVDDNLVFAPSVSQKGYAVTAAKVTTEINRAGSLEITIPPTNPSYSKIMKLKPIITVRQDSEEIWRGRVLEDTKNFYNVKEVFCEGELAFLNDAVVPPYDYSNGITLKNYFNTIVNFYTNNCSEYRKIQAGTITAADPNVIIRQKSDDYSDVMTELSDKLVGSLGGFLQLRVQNGIRYLDYLDELDKVSKQSIIFGKNLIDLSEYVDASEVYTYMIPLGKKDENGNRVDITSVNNGKNYIYSASGEQLFGRITKAIAWDDTTDPATLKSNAQALLNHVIEMSTTIEIRAVDLKLLDVDVDQLTVGEFVPVKSPPHGINSNFLCSKIVLDLLEPDRSEYTFGLVFSALTDKQVSEAKKTANAYETAQTTAENYNSLRTEVYENYVSSAQFSAFRNEVEQNFAEIGDFNPENYATKTQFDNLVSTLTSDYAKKTELENYAKKTELEKLEERVSKLEQGGT